MGQQVKCRLVAVGSQDQRVNMRRYSPTIGKETIKIALQICASKGFKLKTFDFKKAYLNANITEDHGEVYMRPQKSAKTSPGTIWKLNKAVYGLNDSGRNWWLKLNRVMQEIGYEPSNHDQALYYRRNRKTLAIEGIIMTHVDDLMVGASESEHQRFESLLQKTNLEFTKNEGNV